MYTVLLIAHIFVAVSLIGLVLIQHGKGADAGAAFGSGASGTVFGSRGASSFLSKLTALLATGFFATSLVLAILAGPGGGEPESVMNEQAPASQTQPDEEPAAPAEPDVPANDGGPAPPPSEQ